MTSLLPKNTLSLVVGALFSLSLTASSEPTITKESLSKAIESINQLLVARNHPKKDFASWFTLLEKKNYLELRTQISHYRPQAEASQILVDLNTLLISQEQELVTELETFYTKTIKFVVTSLETAKNPADLDKSLIKLNAAKEKLTSFRSDHTHQKLYRYSQATTQKLREATQIVSSWQDYLTYLSSGNKSRAQSSLNSIASKLTSFPIIPRSKILELREKINGSSSPVSNQQSTSELNKITSAFANGQELKKTYRQLKEASFDQPRRQEADKLMVIMTPLIELEKKPDSKSISELIKSYRETIYQKKHIAQRIHKLYLGHLFSALDKKFNTKNSKQNSSVILYLETNIDRYIEQESWALAEQSLTYLEELTPMRPRSHNLRATLEYINNGDHCLQAGLWADAIFNYRKGINNWAPKIPSTLFSKKLIEMQKTDEERYRKASEATEELILLKKYSDIALTVRRLSVLMHRSQPRRLSDRNSDSQTALPSDLQKTLEKFVELKLEAFLSSKFDLTPKK